MNMRTSFALLICAIALCARRADAKVTEIKSETELNEHKGKGKAVLLKVYTTWCGPCKMMAPLYEKVSEMPEHQDVVFLSYDGDKDKNFTKSLDVKAYPTTISYNPKGEMVELVRGSMGETEIGLVAKQAKGAVRMLDAPPTAAPMPMEKKIVQKPMTASPVRQPAQQKTSMKKESIKETVEWVAQEEKGTTAPTSCKRGKKKCHKNSCK